MHQRVPGACFDCGVLVTGLGGEQGVSWSNNWGQLIFLTKLEPQGFVMVIEWPFIGNSISLT